MESKILNFPTAMKLASIISKYTNPETLKDLKAIDFMETLLEKVDAKNYLEIMELLTGTKITKEIPGRELMEIFMSGMIKNDIINLLMAYKRIGIE